MPVKVAVSYGEASQFQSGNPYGASHVSSNGTVPPDEVALTAVRYQARRVVEVTGWLVAGRGKK